MIEVIKAEKRTKSGVYLPDSVHEEAVYGKVLAIGRPWQRENGLIEEAPAFDILNKKGQPLKRYKLKIGDTIIFKRHTQQELNSEQMDFDSRIAFLSFDNILGIELKDKKDGK